MIIIERCWYKYSTDCVPNREAKVFADDDIVGVQDYLNKPGEFKYTKL